MNKTVTINISGIIFHIEEDAYDKLYQYLKTIRGYFSTADGSDEIMTDIEARIAEMLQEKVNKVKQVVLMHDVDEVIRIMGQPEDFAPSSSGSNPSSSTDQATEDYTEFTFKRRRVFRDPDDKILGGVCSGIGNYFGVDPLWLRLVLAIAFFAFGFGFLLYLLLWIIIPKAKTTAEKLEMRGEPVNVNNIKKAVNEELNDLKSRMEDLTDEAKGFTKGENRRRFNNSVDKVTNFFVSVFGGLFRLVGKVFGAIFIFIGIALLVGLLSSMFGASDVIHMQVNNETISYSLHELFDNIFTKEWQQKVAIAGLVLFIAVPLIMLVYNGVKILFRIKATNRPLSITAYSLWLVGLGLLIFVGVSIGKEFSADSVHRQSYNVMQPAGGVMYLKAKNEDRFSDEENGAESRVSFGTWNLIKVDGKAVNFGFPRLNIEPSKNDSFQVVVIKSAKGETKKDASFRAKSINYQFSQTDSLLEFDSFYDIMSHDRWRNQKVKIIVRVPVGKTIYLNRNMKKIIYDIDNIQDTFDHDMVGRKWKMTDEGLTCVDCEGL